MGWWQEQRRAWAHDWGGVADSSRLTVKGTVRIFALITRLVVYGVLFAVLYFFWPTTNLFERPLGSLTLREIAHTVLFVALALVLIRALFDPSEEPTIRKVWAWLGVTIAAASTLALLFLR